MTKTPIETAWELIKKDMVDIAMDCTFQQEADKIEDALRKVEAALQSIEPVGLEELKHVIAQVRIDLEHDRIHDAKMRLDHLAAQGHLTCNKNSENLTDESPCVKKEPETLQVIEGQPTPDDVRELIELTEAYAETDLETLYNNRLGFVNRIKAYANLTKG